MWVFPHCYTNWEYNEKDRLLAVAVKSWDPISGIYGDGL